MSESVPILPSPTQDTARTVVSYLVAPEALQYIDLMAVLEASVDDLTGPQPLRPRWMTSIRMRPSLISYRTRYRPTRSRRKAVLLKGNAVGGRGLVARSSTVSKTIASPAGSSAMNAWAARNASSAQTISQVKRSRAEAVTAGVPERIWPRLERRR